MEEGCRTQRFQHFPAHRAFPRVEEDTHARDKLVMKADGQFFSRLRRRAKIGFGMTEEFLREKWEKLAKLDLFR